MVHPHFLLLPSASGVSARISSTYRTGVLVPNCLNLVQVVSCKQANSSSQLFYVFSVKMLEPNILGHNLENLGSKNVWNVVGMLILFFCLLESALFLS